MQLIKAVWPIDRVRSSEWRTGLCPSRGPRQELRRSLQQSTVCTQGLRGLARNGNNSDHFLVPFLFREKCLTCELLLETLCRLTHCSSCEGVAGLSVF